MLSPQVSLEQRFGNMAVQCSADTFVVNQSLVLRINICGKNRHLLVAANVMVHYKVNQSTKTNLKIFA
jgi:hypothetical protein